MDTKPNQRVHHRIERACSWIETVYSFSVYLYRTESSIGQLFLERLCSPVEPLEQIQCWNLAYRTEGWVGSVNERVYHTVKSSVQNTNRICFARIKRVVLINQTSVFTFTLTLPIILNWKFDRAAIHSNTLDIQGLRDERYRPVNAL